MSINLSAEQARVVSYRSGHLQVIACAGSGKTEAISRRVASLVSEGVAPDSIVAFTFTERAAEELKARIVLRVAEQLGNEAKGRLSSMFVGTIHGYCLRLLQTHVPKYGDFDVLDPNQHAALLSREHKRLSLASLGVIGHWQPIRDFMETVDVISNELISPEQLDGTLLGTVYRDYLATLDRFHFLTFGRIIQMAVESLSTPEILASVRSGITHLIVDEFQDINPAQDALIRILGADPVQVCVVGDDDQSIYQWRGSDISSIHGFQRRFKGSTSVTLAANRRSRKQIVEAAATFATLITPRLPKQMLAHREAAPNAVTVWSAETPESEAETIAATIERLHNDGLAYRDIGVLFRSVRTSAPVLIDALRDRNIPYTCGGRTGLFLQPEIAFLGRAYIWLVDNDWRDPGFGQQAVAVTLEDLVTRCQSVFEPKQSDVAIRRMLEDWKKIVTAENKPADLINDFYEVLRFLGAHTWDIDNPQQASRIGALARFSSILADFEHVTRRGRWVEEEGTRVFTGGQDRGIYYYQRLANFIQHFARDAYEEFEGEECPDLDAVDITTVHGAKGLEWPVVFMPALQDRRFPSSMSGKAKDWILPIEVLPQTTRSRYEGSESEERRLFYVGMTRARDAIYLSCFERQKIRSAPSRFLTDLVGKNIPHMDVLPLPSIDRAAQADSRSSLNVSFSSLADFENCGHEYRLSESVGFQRQIVSQLGYGKAIHHVLRRIADQAKETGRIPDIQEALKLVEAELYLPFANRTNAEVMTRAASRLVEKYLVAFRDDLNRVWATERNFELHLTDAIVAGRSDVILSHHNGVPDSLAIVDYKTVKDSERDAMFEFQLQVYAVAGRAEGIGIDAALLHHLIDGRRTPVDISPATTTAVLARVNGLVDGLRLRQFSAKPEPKKCKGCDFRRICKHAPSDPWVDD